MSNAKELIDKSIGEGRFSRLRRAVGRKVDRTAIGYAIQKDPLLRDRLEFEQTESGFVFTGQLPFNLAIKKRGKVYRLDTSGVGNSLSPDEAIKLSEVLSSLAELMPLLAEAT